MRHALYIIMCLVLALIPSQGWAQEPDAALCPDRLAMLRNIAGFDHEYPREKVYLHLDNTAYIEGDTLWFKAYVVQADLRPTTLSRVLYVELLNAGGQMMDQKLIRLDSLGQGDGMFDLNLPVTNGFYEVRAYTREMRNWGDAACYSRVLPVFERPKAAGDFSHLNIKRPEAEYDLVNYHERPWNFGRKASRRVLFFPEGGRRVGGLPQRIAYLMMNGRDEPCEDTLRIYDAAGSLILSSAPEHLGMGSFTLPAGFEGGYAEVGRKKFDLPEAHAECLTADIRQDADSLQVILCGHAPRKVAAALLCRERLLWCDTLDMPAGPREISLPHALLGHGVNRFVVFDTAGQALAERQFWGNARPLRKAQVSVRQSAELYDPFRPIAIEVDVADAKGQPLSTPLALSVRDARGDLIYDASARMEAQWLLASEVKGYVASPEWYFEQPDDPVRRRALDLLLMVQGWTAQPVSVMAGAEPFDLRQPIEDRLILRGKVIKDKEKIVPYPNMKLSLTLLSPDGHSATGEAVTDAQGEFSFLSNVDYSGDLMGIFNVKDIGDDERKWSRVMLDRWFGPVPRPYSPQEITLESQASQPQTLNSKFKIQNSTPLSPQDLFQWTDTLTNIRSYLLNEAHVKAKDPHRYKGLNFSYYTYMGGEKMGHKYMEYYWNVPIELERAKDTGLDFYSMHDFFNYLLDHRPLAYDTYRQDQAILADTPPQMDENGNIVPANEATNDKNKESTINFRGQGVTIFLNNGIGAVGTDSSGNESIYPTTKPEEIKSCMLTHKYRDPEIFDQDPTWYLFVYTREDWHKWRQKKGFTKRHIWGFAEPVAFPRLNYYELPKDNLSDYRRTLYWAPALHTDDAGHASAVFFSNARGDQQLSFSISGLTPDGQIISYER